MKNVLKELKKIYTKLFVSPYSIFLIGFIILSLCYLFRGFILHGQESYFYYRISSFILENNVPNYDFLSFGGRAFFYSIGSPLFLVLVNLVFRISLVNILVFIPFIFGFLSLILFYYILKHFKISKIILSFACYFLILSPPFLYSFTHFTSFTIPLFLNLLGFFLILKNKKFLNVLAFLIYLLLPFFGFIHIFFGLLLLLFYFYKFGKLKSFIPYLFIFLFAVYLNNQFINFGLDIINYNFYQLFFDFGGVFGLSIFLLFLVFFGLAKLWERKYSNLDYYLFFILTLFILILYLKYLIYFNLILCILGAYGLKYIYKMKWNSILIRNLTVLLLILGIIFSGVSFLSENFKLDPDEETYEVLVFLEKRTSPRNVILSHEKYGSYINSISKRKSFIDYNYAYAPRLELRLFYLNKIFYSRDLTRLLNIVNEFKVSHILITPEMKNGLVWSGDKEGLLHLLNINPTYFNLMYDKNGFEVWRVL